jgi:hypothetical protein
MTVKKFIVTNTIMKSFIAPFALLASQMLYAQDLPYREVPEAPSTYTATHVAARLIDGLGMRYYWATENLREEDLAYRPSPEARTCRETLLHIHAMSVMIANAAAQQPVVLTTPPGSFSEMRKQTLQNFKLASDNLKAANDSEMEKMDLVMKRGESQSVLPFWNLINGPLSDCLWHVGQVVSFRRASGNPLSNKINVLTGKVME